MTSTPSLGAVALQAFGALLIALLSAWITVKLSQRKFREERMWDRKAAAYERIIEAFHKSKKFSSEHLDAQYESRELVEDRDKELRRLSAEAREEISRAADVGSFTLSARAL
jgi:flagellar biosynthesis/type III secretory pathway M-ring protein FliF/YscJ